MVKYLKPVEVASLLDVNAATVNRWAREGKLTFVKTPGGHRRYQPEQFVKFGCDVREYVS